MLLKLDINKGRKGDFIGTYNGGKFWPLDPRAEDVDFIDIAHSLALICRFNGHTKFHWSIAQHSLLVDKLLRDYYGQKDNHRLRLLGLLHDASEAYISDLPRPFKKDVVGYKDIEESIEDCILKYCGLTDVSKGEVEIVRAADNSALVIEALVLMKPDSDWTLLDFWNDELEKYKQEIKEDKTYRVAYKFMAMCSNMMERLDIKIPWREYDQDNGG